MNHEDRQRLEADAFKEEYNNCPESVSNYYDDLFITILLIHLQSTLEDYEDVPVEEFGAALLRGMGWKDGQGIGRGHREK
jgi:hypothetical protein